MSMRRSYYSCSVFGCLNTTRNSEYAFFGLPTDNEKRAVWLNLIDREDVTNKRSTFLRVCEAHFDHNAIKKTEARVLLKRDAYPKLLLPKKKYDNKETQTTLETTESSTQYERSHCESLSQSAVNISASPQKRKILQVEHDIPECSKRRKTTNPPETCDKLHIEKQCEVVKEQARLKSSSQRNRYSLDYKMFSLKLFYTSPQTYNLINESLLLNMPSKITLQRMYMPINTKVNSYVMEILKTKANGMTDMEKNCSLIIDSINVKSNLFYKKKEDRICGFHEIDGIQSPEPAKYALVAMMQGIFTNYKQPVGLALLGDSKNKECVWKWIEKLIKMLFEIGLKIRVLVTNTSLDFRSSAKESGLTIETPYFFVDSNKIFYIFDAPHLIKSVRNNLMNYDFHFNGCVAKWDHIIQFYKIDKTQATRTAPKITESHINPKNNIEKTDVKLAVEILSATVASSLSLYKKFGAIDSSAEGTIELVKVMNNLFDFLNSSVFFRSTEYQHVFGGTAPQIKFLEEMIKFFGTLKLICPKTGKQPTRKFNFLKGFQITLKSILLLFEDLKSEGHCYLMTRKLNQDCLKIFFGSLRNGSSKVPSWLLVWAFRNIFLFSIIKQKQGTGSEDLSDLLESNNLYASLSEEKSSTAMGKQACIPKTRSLQEENINGNPTISSADYNAFNLPEKGALVYTCGYLLEKCFDQHSDCSLLKDYLRSADRSLDFLRDTKFIRYRDYCKNGGSPMLIIPQDNFVRFVEAMDNTFASYFKNKHMKSCKVLENLLKEVEYVSFLIPCTCFPIMYIKKLFFRMRLFQTLNYNNRAFKQGKCFSVKKL